MKRIVATVLAAALLAASGPAWARGQFSAEKARPLPPQNGGIVIISTSAERNCWAYGISVVITPDGDIKGAKGAYYIHVDNPLIRSEFSDHIGSLNVIPLPAGHYRIEAYPANGLEYYFKVKPIWAFTVEPGQATYIGDLDISPSCTMAPGLQIIDRQDRDLAVLTQKNPAFKDVAVAKRLAVPVN